MGERFASFFFQGEPNSITMEMKCFQAQGGTVPSWGQELVDLLSQLFKKSPKEVFQQLSKIVLRYGRGEKHEEVLCLLYTSVRSSMSKLFLSEIVKIAQSSLSCCGVVLLIQGEGALLQFEQVLWGRAFVQDFFCEKNMVVSTDISYSTCPQLYEQCRANFSSYMPSQPMVVFDPFCSNGWALVWISSLLKGSASTFYGRESNAYAFFDACENVPYAHLMKVDLGAAWERISGAVSVLFLNLPWRVSCHPLKFWGSNERKELLGCILRDKPTHIFYLASPQEEQIQFLERLLIEGWNPVLQVGFSVSGEQRRGVELGLNKNNLYLLKRG